jgi:trehalose 2-sulfotransferase
MAGAGVDAYLICGTPRTGSTLLCGLLRSTQVAGMPESYFRQPDEPAWAERWQLPRDAAGGFDYRDYVRAAVAVGSTANGVFGARVMWGTLDEMVARLGAVQPELAGADLDLLVRAFGRTRFVHLWRDDTVAQAVSWARAEQTSFWHEGDAASPRPPRFDLDQIRELVDTIDAHNAAWRNWFAAFDVDPHQVRYESLVSDMTGVTLGILDFLGLERPAGAVIASPHRRQADHINDEWIALYRRHRDSVPE